MGDQKSLLIALLKVLVMKIQKKCLLVAFFSVSLLVVGCGGKLSVKNISEASETAAETATENVTTEVLVADPTVLDGAVPDGLEQVAGGDESGSQLDVVEEGMVPVYADEIKDGVYQVKVDSSSGMFQVTACELTVKDGAMSVVMTMSGTGYLKLYMGTGMDAVQAAEAEYIPFAEAKDGTHTYNVPVAALDMGIDCSAFSKRKEKWYDRVLLFRADSLPAEAFAEGKITTAESLNLVDGSYTAAVTLTGGGRPGFGRVTGSPAGEEWTGFCDDYLGECQL